jgi:RNA polymerase sigma factor (sigma-70 family)
VENGGLLRPADPARDAAEDVEREEARERVRRALAALSEKERLLLLMREEGFKHREIAEAVGTTTASVGTLIARALVKLAGQLGLAEPTEES